MATLFAVLPCAPASGALIDSSTRLRIASGPLISDALRKLHHFVFADLTAMCRLTVLASFNAGWRK